MTNLAVGSSLHQTISAMEGVSGTTSDLKSMISALHKMSSVVCEASGDIISEQAEQEEQAEQAGQDDDIEDVDAELERLLETIIPKAPTTKLQSTLLHDNTAVVSVDVL